MNRSLKPALAFRLRYLPSQYSVVLRWHTKSHKVTKISLTFLYSLLFCLDFIFVWTLFLWETSCSGLQQTVNKAHSEKPALWYCRYQLFCMLLTCGQWSGQGRTCDISWCDVKQNITTLSFSALQCRRTMNKTCFLRQLFFIWPVLPAHKSPTTIRWSWESTSRSITVHWKLTRSCNIFNGGLMMIYSQNNGSWWIVVVSTFVLLRECRLEVSGVHCEQQSRSDTTECCTTQLMGAARIRSRNLLKRKELYVFNWSELY